MFATRSKKCRTTPVKSCWKLLTACCCRRVEIMFCLNCMSLFSFHFCILHAWAWLCLLSQCRISWPFQIIQPANGWKGCFKRRDVQIDMTSLFVSAARFWQSDVIKSCHSLMTWWLDCRLFRSLARRVIGKQEMDVTTLSAGIWFCGTWHANFNLTKKAQVPWETFWKGPKEIRQDEDHALSSVTTDGLCWCLKLSHWGNRRILL